MVNTIGTGRNQAGNILRGDMIVDTFIFLQTKGTLHKALAEHIIASPSDMSAMWHFHSPANIITVWRNIVALKNILLNTLKGEKGGKIYDTRLTSSSETLIHP